MQAAFLLSAESGIDEKGRNERPKQMKESQLDFSSFRTGQVISGPEPLFRSSLVLGTRRCLN